MLFLNTTKVLKVLFFRALSLVLFFFILPLVTCPSWGQVVQKKQLTAADYHLWGSLQIGKIAPDEKWASYKMSYQSGADTLFVRNTGNDKTYSFPSADQSDFTKDNYFVCSINNEIHVTDPVTGRREITPKVVNYSYCSSADLLILLAAGSEKTNTLIIKHPLDKILKEIHDVTHYSVSPGGHELVYSISFNGENSVFLTDLSKLKNSKLIINSPDFLFDTFTWQKDDRAFAFYANSAAESIESLYLFTLKNDKLFKFEPATQKGFPQGFSIIDFSTNGIIISDDLQKVFFTIKAKKIPQNPEDSNVEIWNANDKWVYTQEQRHGRFDESPKVVLWHPFSGNFTQITTPELPAIILSTNFQYAILSNPKQYEPRFDDHEVRDYFILDLKTLEKNIFLTRQSAFYLDMFVSPTGKYISYLRDNNWWIYNIDLKKHINITAKLGIPFVGKVHKLKDNFAFGNPGWSLSDNEILLYDEFDIWAIKPDGSTSRRLTHGREANIHYRLDLTAKRNTEKYLYNSRLLEQYDLNKELFLRAVGEDGKTGYFSWKKDTGEKPILYTDYFIDEFTYGQKKQKIFCIEQSFSLPPRLISIEDKSVVKCVFQSNPQHERYYWGKNEMIYFQNSKKEKLKGILYYPANFNPNKKYPMIVSIYEVLSDDLHQYYNPSLYNESGFNAAVFTSQGYFVLLPDIKHEIENVGTSTTDCVVSGTKKVVELGFVDSSKIALMGHSFGGYETAFVINQTPIFATAIASGAIVDLTRRFLELGVNTTRPEMWRFASGGWRLGKKTIFANRADFDRNSPLEFIEKLQIPLLMWTGKEDLQVNSYQSMSYYLALRRLGKKCIFLQYPKEGHTLLNPINQKDLNLRVLQWLGHYLKDEKTNDWISNGTI